MVTLTQAIATYSYLDRPPVDLGPVNPSSADVALLVQINQAMTAAAAAFTARNYQSAISQYKAVEALIYAHLDPEWSPPLGNRLRVRLPRDPALFDPLLSASSQWLNILPVPFPASPVRPATTPTASLLASIAPLHGAGLGLVAANPTSTAAALADLSLATIYADQGNLQASSIHLASAKTLDASVTSVIATANKIPETTADQARPPTPAPDPGTTIQLKALAPSATLLPITALANRREGMVTGSTGSYGIGTIQWGAGGAPDIEAIKKLIYGPHIVASLLPDGLQNPMTLPDAALILPHDYFYTIPMALAAAYAAEGDYATAESYYLEAAGYAYLNAAIEGPYIWVQLATLYLNWGNSYYKAGNAATALQVYSNVLTPGSVTAPNAQLYTLAGLSVAAAIAKTLIPNLANLVANGTTSVSADDIAIATVLLQVWGREEQINASLDYLGNYTPAVPIWTFEYLQQVAINFTQIAQQLEQSVINFWAQADAGNLTQSQLQGQASQAAQQVSAANAALSQAKAQALAYGDGVALAQQRANDAATNASQYNTLESQSIYYQSMVSVSQAGDGGAAGLYFSGTWGPGPVTQASINAASSDIFDTTAQGALAEWTAAAYNQLYQVQSLQSAALEMQQAAVQAQQQYVAAQAQVTVAQANLAVAQCQANSAAQNLAVFNGDNFTPQVWQYMGNFAFWMYEQYMQNAISVAMLMQQAYNFENDSNLSFIGTSYPGAVSYPGGWVAGLLGAESLMAGIQSFTYDLVTTYRGKKQLIKTSISLAGHNGYLFETQLRNTGTMTFETTLDDFDSVFPGSYQGRIQSVSVSVQGIVPPTGISGTLTNGGISWYRLPSDIATPTNPSKLRIQNSESLVISDYNPTTDGVINSTTGNQLGIFEGAGVASTWTLSLPPAVNDIDFTTLTDVVITFLYEARFDTKLVPTVISQLASRPGFYSRERMIPLAWAFPDLFFNFIATGNLTLSLSASDFPANQTAPVVNAISLLVTINSAGAAQGITLSLTAPGKAATPGVTNAGGVITSQGTSAPLAGITGGSALGNWVINLSAAANPALAPGGQLNLSSLTNIFLMMDYTFTPRA